jgi:hypothetical protein
MSDSLQVLGPNQLKIVEALKSGKYHQLRFAMVANDGVQKFCVLGLIAHLCAAFDISSFIIRTYVIS